MEAQSILWQDQDPRNVLRRLLYQNVGSRCRQELDNPLLHQLSGDRLAHSVESTGNYASS
jgi:hypothetical protein